MSRTTQIANRYAKALFGSVKNHEASLNELRSIAKILNDDQNVKSFFASNGYSDQLKTDLLIKAFTAKGLTPELFQFLNVLALKGRVHLVDEILLAYQELVDAENGVIRGSVRSAVQLDQDARLRIEKVVSHFVNRKVILTYFEDPSLVGGVVTQVGGWTFEDTLDSHLIRLKEDLNRRAN